MRARIASKDSTSAFLFVTVRQPSGHFWAKISRLTLVDDKKKYRFNSDTQRLCQFCLQKGNTLWILSKECTHSLLVRVRQHLYWTCSTEYLFFASSFLTEHCFWYSYLLQACQNYYIAHTQHVCLLKLHTAPLQEEWMSLLAPVLLVPQFWVSCSCRWQLALFVHSCET